MYRRRQNRECGSRRVGGSCEQLRPRQSANGFTLIELLTVIAIISLLMGLLLAVMNRMRMQARRAQAASDVAQIATAWNAYLEDHRTWPDGAPLTEMDARAINLLRGDNPRRRSYMDYHPNSEDHRDPWGHVYQLALDYTRNNQVPDPGHPHRTRVDQVWAPVLVWSWGGPDGVTNATRRQIVGSTR